MSGNILHQLVRVSSLIHSMPIPYIPIKLSLTGTKGATFKLFLKEREIILTE